MYIKIQLENGDLTLKESKNQSPMNQNAQEQMKEVLVKLIMLYI